MLFILLGLFPSIIGLSLYYWNRHSIIFSKRVPGHLIAHQIGIICILGLVSVEIELGMTFTLNQRRILGILFSIIAPLTMVIMLIQKICLIQTRLGDILRKTCCNDNKTVSMWKTSWISGLLVIVSLCNHLYFPEDKYLEIGIYPNMVVIGLFVIIEIVMIMVMVSVFMERKLDKIGAHLEMIVFALSTPLLLVLLWYFDVQHIARFGECLLVVFCGLYVPFMVTIKHNHTISAKSMATLDDPRLFGICKQFYCEEMMFFLRRYKEFAEGKIDSDTIIKQFIDKGSLCELNITDFSRQAVLQSQTQDILYEELEIIYLDVCQLMRDNLLPHLSGSTTVMAQ